MASRKREQLLGYLLGALDDAERERLEEQLQRDPRLRQELGQVEESLRPLRQARQAFAPPRGLAARTCAFVALFASPFSAEVNEAPVALRPSRRKPVRVRARRMSPAAAPPSSSAPWGWADLAVAACIMVATALLVLPAIERGRMNSRLVACQDRLRNFGMSLAQANESHPQFLPQFLRANRQANFGIPPVVLAGNTAADDRQDVPPPAPRLPVDRLSPQRSVHLGIAQEMRGQNVVFADGHVAFIATAPPIAADTGFWFSDGAGQPGSSPTVPMTPVSFSR
jgi:prepilin-type processing-associated H-X9-DG protein